MKRDNYYGFWLLVLVLSAVWLIGVGLLIVHTIIGDWWILSCIIAFIILIIAFAATEIIEEGFSDPY